MLGIAKHIKHILDQVSDDGSLSSIKQVIKALTQYAELITPWAVAISKYMCADVARRNEKAWIEHGNEIGKSIRKVVEQTPVGAVLRESLGRQVPLIKSLPLEAAQRVHELVQDALPKGTRSTELAKEIMKSSSIPKWRAKLIARTEVSRLATELTQARARALGSEGYIWQTVGDFDVRPDHQHMAGKYVRWDNPPSFPNEPTLGPYHAGGGPNCRCWPRPVLPEF